MSMVVPDKGWMTFERHSKTFRDGLTIFTEFAIANTIGKFEEGKLPCPCVECSNRKVIAITEIRKHVLLKGWASHYRT